MDASNLMNTVEIIQKISALPDLRPQTVAAALDREVRVDREDEYLIECTLIGGISLPFGKVTAAWVKSESAGMMEAHVAEGVRLPMRELHNAVSPALPPLPLPGDPRNPQPKRAYAYQVPVGELHLVFPDFEEQYFLATFGLTQMPDVPWEDLAS